MWGGFPGGSNGKESAYNAGVPGSIPGSGRCPGEGNGNPLQYSCLENPMDRGAWWASPQSYKELDIPEQLMLSQQIWRKERFTKKIERTNGILFAFLVNSDYNL